MNTEQFEAICARYEAIIQSKEKQVAELFTIVAELQLIIASMSSKEQKQHIIAGGQLQ